MPEHNLIQQPELLRRVAKRFGLVQAHIAPALNEGIQLVAIVDDLRNIKELTPQSTFGGTSTVIGDAITQVGYFCLENPAGSGVAAYVHNLNISIAPHYSGLLPAPGTDDLLEVAVDTTAPTATITSRNRAYPMTGIITSSTARSRCFVVIGTVGGGFGMANIIDTRVVTGENPRSWDYERHWEIHDGPVLYPGRSLEVIPLLGNPNVQAAVTVEWFEEPER